MKKDGFTLVEIMVLMAIIGLLSAILIPSFVSARHSAICKKIGLSKVGYSDGNLYALNESTFEVFKVDTSLHKIVNCVGVVNVSRIAIDKWENINRWKDKEAWLLSTGTKVVPIDNRKEVVNLSINNEFERIAEIVKNTPPVVEMSGVKYYREDQVEKMLEDKKITTYENTPSVNKDGYSKRSSDIKSFLEGEF